MDAKRLALRCRALAEGKKAEDLVVLDVRGLSSITDFFVLASGTSEPHLRAIVEEIVEKLEKEHHLRPRARDGTWASHWVVLDYLDVIVHVMHPDTRALYPLESLWGDAPRLRAGRSSRPRARQAAQAASPDAVDGGDSGGGTVGPS